MCGHVSLCLIDLCIVMVFLSDRSMYCYGAHVCVCGHVSLCLIDLCVVMVFLSDRSMYCYGLSV